MNESVAVRFDVKVLISKLKSSRRYDLQSLDTHRKITLFVWREINSITVLQKKRKKTFLIFQLYEKNVIEDNFNKIFVVF